MVRVATWRIFGCCLLKSRWTSSHRTWLLQPELLMLGRVSREEEKRMLDMSVSLLAESHSTIFSHSLGLDSNQLQEHVSLFSKTQQRLFTGTLACSVRLLKSLIPPPDIWDPPEGSLYFAKKTCPPLTGRTHQLSSHARKCLLITHKKMNTPPASWNPASWEADL